VAVDPVEELGLGIAEARIVQDRERSIDPSPGGAHFPGAEGRAGGRFPPFQHGLQHLGGPGQVLGARESNGGNGQGGEGHGVQRRAGLRLRCGVPPRQREREAIASVCLGVA
jgi:hypothetical protein